MKRIFIALLLLCSASAYATEMCEVKVCNKLERFTMSFSKMWKDSMGEVCFDALVSKADAVEGKVLSQESRWYQGSSFNPSKKSVTRVRTVYNCTK